jgi:hypothetical protein
LKMLRWTYSLILSTTASILLDFDDDDDVGRSFVGLNL